MFFSSFILFNEIKNERYKLNPLTDIDFCTVNIKNGIVVNAIHQRSTASAGGCCICMSEAKLFPAVGTAVKAMQHKNTSYLCIFIMHLRFESEAVSNM